MTAHGTRPHLATEFHPPTTDVEVLIAGMWEELLGISPIGAHDDFFALGGHSLLATQIVSRCRDQLGLELPLATIFEAPTPRAASRIEGGTAFSAARVEITMVGSVISVSVRPPTRGADCGRCANWMKTARPRMPNTIDGTARLAMFTSMKSVKRFSGANSSR